MLLEVIIAAVLLGLLAGGKLSRLNELELRGSGLMFAALLAQLGLPKIATSNPTLAPHILVVSFAVLLIALRLNKKTPAIVLMSFGVLLNFIVVAANNGMPVETAALSSAAADLIHIPITDSTLLPWLGDIIPWPMPGALGGLVSIGDLFLSLGVFLLLFNGMMYIGRRRKKTL